MVSYLFTTLTPPRVLAIFICINLLHYPLLVSYLSFIYLFTAPSTPCVLAIFICTSLLNYPHLVSYLPFSICVFSIFPSLCSVYLHMYAFNKIHPPCVLFIFICIYIFSTLSHPCFQPTFFKTYLLHFPLLL